ncbi:hypothetical protein Tco_0097735 [Tanacetum coccineum]
MMLLSCGGRTQLGGGWRKVVALLGGQVVVTSRFGIGIRPRQGILGESTSSKFHFAVLGTVATRKYRFSSFKPTNETNSSFRTIEVEKLATHKLLLSLPEHNNTIQQQVSGFQSESYLVLQMIDSGGGVVDLNGDEDPTDEDGDIRMGDSTSVSAYLGGEIFSGGKKCRESNIGDSDNTRDGGKIVTPPKMCRNGNMCGGGDVGGGGVIATAVSRGDGRDGGRCGAWRRAV